MITTEFRYVPWIREKSGTCQELAMLKGYLARIKDGEQ